MPETYTVERVSLHFLTVHQYQYVKRATNIQNSCLHWMPMSPKYCMIYHLFVTLLKQGFFHSMAHGTSYPMYKYISLGNWVQKQAAQCGTTPFPGPRGKHFPQWHNNRNTYAWWDGGMLLRIITHVVPYLHSIMHMHFYCYLTGGTAYLLDRESEWCYGVLQIAYHLGYYETYQDFHKKSLPPCYELPSGHYNMFALKRTSNM